MNIQGKSSIAFRLEQLELETKALRLLIEAQQGVINALIRKEIYLK